MKSDNRLRGVFAGGKYGLYAGFALATAEIFWIGVASVNPPFIFLLYMALGDVFLLGIIGAATGPFVQKDGRISVIPVAILIVVVYCLGNMSFIPAVNGALRQGVFATCLLAVAIFVISQTARKKILTDQEPGDLFSVALMLLISFGMVSALFVNKLYLPDLGSARSLISNGILGAGFVSAFACLCRTGIRKQGFFARWNRLGRPVLLFLFLGVSVLSLLNPVAATGIEFVKEPQEKEEGLDPNMPSVILIVIDTLRADHISAYGYPRKTTPNIDRFSEASILYKHAVSTSSWTLPAHASLLTGLLPSEHGAHTVSMGRPGLNAEASEFLSNTAPAAPLPESATTLAEVLNRSGYTCGAVVSNCIWLWDGFQLDQGFHRYDDQPGARIPDLALFDLRDDPILGEVFEHELLWYRDATDITDTCIDWIKGNDNVPFFLFVNYMDTHNPWAPPPEYRSIFNEASEEEAEAEKELLDDVRKGKVRLPDGIRREWIDKYDAELRYVDTELGRLLSWLKENGLYDHALIIITSDHGESFGGHFFLEHGNSLYEQEIWIPLIIKYPNSSNGGTKIPEATSLATVPNIILQTLGMAPLAPSRFRPVAELFINWDKVAYFGSRYKRNLRAIYVGKKKYILDCSGGVETYDLAKDPTEQHDLATVQRDPKEEIARELRAWMQVLERQNSASQNEMVVNKEIVEQLKAVGYLQ